MGWVTYWIAVYAWVQRRDPKTGQEKVQFYCKDNSLFLSSYYLSVVYVHCTVHHKCLYSKSLAKTTDSATKSAKLRITRICSKYKIILINIVLFIELFKFSLQRNINKSKRFLNFRSIKELSNIWLYKYMQWKISFYIFNMGIFLISNINRIIRILLQDIIHKNIKLILRAKIYSHSFVQFLKG